MEESDWVHVHQSMASARLPEGWVGWGMGCGGLKGRGVGGMEDLKPDVRRRGAGCDTICDGGETL